MTRKCWILSIWWKKSLCHAQHEFWAYASLPSNAKEKKKVNEAFVILTGLLEDECETKLCQLLSVKHGSAQNKNDALQWVLKTKTLWREIFPARAKL
jgi:hypothetical protein